MRRALLVLAVVPLLLGADNCGGGVGTNRPSVGTITQRYTMPRPNGTLYVLHYVNRHGDLVSFRKTYKREPAWWDNCVPGEDAFPRCAPQLSDIDLGALR